MLNITAINVDKMNEHIFTDRRVQLLEIRLDLFRQLHRIYTFFVFS